jgi:hypothetical protein
MPIIKKILSSGGIGTGYFIVKVTDDTTPGSQANPRLALDSESNIVLSVNGYQNNTQKSALIKMDSVGDLTWANIVTHYQLNDQYGIAVDSQDRIITAYSRDGTTNASFFRFLSDGTEDVQYFLQSWTSDAQQIMLIESDVLYHSEGYIQGHYWYATDVSGSSFSGAPTWFRREIDMLTEWFVHGFAVDSTYLYSYGRVGALSGRHLRLEGVPKSTGDTSTGTAKKITFSGYTYPGCDVQEGGLVLDDSGNVYIGASASNDDVYSDTVLLAKLDPIGSGFTQSWCVTLDYSNRNKLNGAAVCLDSTGLVHLVAHVTNDGGNSGIFVETFNASGVFQREYIIQLNGATSYSVAQALVDDANDLHITAMINDGSYNRAFVIKIPCNYTNFTKGTRGSYILTYNTSSTFTLGTATATIVADTFDSTSLSYNFQTDSTSTVTTSTTTELVEQYL